MNIPPIVTRCLVVLLPPFLLSFVNRPLAWLITFLWMAGLGIAIWVAALPGILLLVLAHLLGAVSWLLVELPPLAGRGSKFATLTAVCASALYIGGPLAYSQQAGKGQDFDMEVVTAGRDLLSSCSSCHRGDLEIAPTLDGVFGREIAGIPRYEYSDTLRALQGNWTRENLYLYLTDPFNFAPDNNMGMGPMTIDDATAIISALEYDAR